MMSDRIICPNASDLGSGNIDVVATIAGTGKLNIAGTAATNASVPAALSANRYLQIKVNGTTYYLPLATASW